jgi:hypothetical protein
MASGTYVPVSRPQICSKAMASGMYLRYGVSRVPRLSRQAVLWIWSHIKLKGMIRIRIKVKAGSGSASKR